MLKLLAFIVLVNFSSTEASALSSNNNYSVDQFTSDCLEAGGTPLIFLNSVVCENALDKTITCLRTEEDISACKLEAMPR